MAEPIVIFGIGGFGREVHALLDDINNVTRTFDILGYLDADNAAYGELVHGLPVLGGVDWVKTEPGINIAIAVGSPVSKYRIHSQLQPYDVKFPTIISPRAWVGPHVSLGAGTIICAGTSVTTDIQIGSFCTLNLSVTIGHDSSLGDFTTISPGSNVSGNVHFHEGVELGTNVSIIPGVTIGEWTLVGAGAVVTKNLEANVTAVGAPAKVIKQREHGWHTQS